MTQSSCAAVRRYTELMAKRHASQTPREDRRKYRAPERFPEVLEPLFLSGVDTFRLNFKHGGHEDHAKVQVVVGGVISDRKRVDFIIEIEHSTKPRIVGTHAHFPRIRLS
jgi:hypothetical protein